MTRPQAEPDAGHDDLSLTARQVDAVRRGDSAAFDELCRRYLPRVRRIVAARMGMTLRAFCDHDDVVQETFADAVASIERFDHRSDGSFCHWIARCVENNVRDAARRGTALKRGQGHVARFADLEPAALAESIFGGDEPTPSQHALGHETEARIEAALLQLSERHREVINLRAHCGMSYREIADVMGLRTENSANLLFLRARDKLGTLLASRGS